MKSLKFSMVLMASSLVCAPALAAKQPVVTQSSLATITNTGSTNTKGYQIEVSADGDCLIDESPDRSVLSQFHRQFTIIHGRSAPSVFAVKPGKISRSMAQQFFRDIKVAMPLSQLPITHTFKSVSFGTSTYVGYKGLQTPDLSSPADARGKALAADVKDIVATLGLNNLPRRPIGPMTPPVPEH